MNLGTLRSLVKRLDGLDDSLRICAPLISGSTDKVIPVTGLIYGRDQARDEDVLIVTTVLDDAVEENERQR